MLVKIQPYKIKKQEKLDLTTSESNIDVKGVAVMIHNAGTGSVYVDTQTGVNSNKWEIQAGEDMGPVTAADKLYFVSSSTSTIKLLFLEV